MTCDSLQTIQESLNSTLTILHNEAGVCHGNITAENILLLKTGERDQALLSSFTEARFKVDAEKSASWEFWKMKDRKRLSGIFGKLSLIQYVSLHRPYSMIYN